MSIKKIVLVLIVLCAGLAFCIANMLSGGELASKQVYAALQTAEFDHRTQVGELILYDERDALLLAGFLTKSSSRVWVAMNRLKSNGDLFVIPDHGEKRISCNIISQLSPSAMIDSSVVENLKASCARP